MRRARRLAGEHFLYGLAGDSQLPGDLGLGEALGDQAAKDVAALGVELLRQARVPDGLVADLPQALESLLVRRDVGLLVCHAPSMTTRGCHVKWGLSCLLAFTVANPAVLALRTTTRAAMGRFK
jgi:hypothetical protein